MSRDADRTSSSNIRSSRHHHYLVKLLGLSSSTTKDDIKKFLHPCHFLTILFIDNGNSSNDCLVDLESETDLRNALKKNNSTIGNRSIEVIRTTVYEYNFHKKQKGKNSWHDPVVHMNGLPYTCTMADIQNFFKDVSIARNGIYISRDMTDDACGGGYVAFVSMDNAYKALDIYNQQNIQHRYIELTPSSYDEARKTIRNDAFLNGKRFAGENIDEENNSDRNGQNNRSRNRNKRRSRSISRDRSSRPEKRRQSPSPRSQSRPQTKRSRDDHLSRSPVRHSSPDNGEYLVKMRGMPFNVTEDDIRKFFPSTCKPVRIEILQNHRTKRPNGDGHVYFNTRDEIDQAMTCDRKYMGNRYIELYFDSPRLSPASDHRHSQTHETSPLPSRSPSKSKDDIDHTPSRSESEHELI